MCGKRLTDSQLRAIRLLISAGHTDKQISDYYGVTEGYVGTLRRTWAK